MSPRVDIKHIHGVPIALYKMSSIEVVVVTIDFKAGSYYEPHKNWGGVHFMEHMVHEGTKQFPHRDALEYYKEEYAINQNASTSGQILSFEANFPTVSLKEGFRVLSEIVTAPTIPENELAKEKNVVTQEYRDKWSQPNNRFWKAKVSYLYGDSHFMTHDALGQPEYVQSLTKKDVESIYQDCVKRNTMSITVVGNFEETELEGLLTSFIAQVPEGSPQTLPVKKPQSKGTYLWHKEDMDKVSIDIAFLFDPRSEITKRDRMILLLGSYILGGSPRSRIFRKLRGELGLVYSAGSMVMFGQCASEFHLIASTSLSDAKVAKEELLKALHTLKNVEITDEEFERARKYLNLSTLTGYDSPYRISDNISGELFFDGTVIPPQEIISLVNTIQKEEIAMLYKKYVSNDPIVMVMAKEDPKLQ